MSFPRSYLACLVTLFVVCGCGADDGTKRARDTDGGVEAGADVEASVTEGAAPTEDVGPVLDAFVSEPDADIVAAFLAVEMSGSGSGAITSDPAGIDCGEVCSTVFAEDTTVTLTAVPEPGSEFAGWQGSCEGQGPVCMISVAAGEEINVSARFEIADPTLEVTLSGDGTGRVVDADGDLDCPDICAGEYDPGETVELTALPAPSSEFVRWTGACEGSDPECTIALDEASSVEAVFALKRYTLDLTSSGPGSGIVELVAPADTDCTESCTLVHGTEVMVVATADTGSSFLGWNGGVCNGTEPECGFEIVDDTSVDASFALGEFGLVVSRTGSGQGSVLSEPEGIDCAPTCAYPFDFGTSVTLTAAPANDSTFTGWTGCDAVDGYSCTVSIDEAREVESEFTLKQYDLTVEKTGSGGGTVVADDDSIDCGSVCSEAYDHGTVVVLTAQAEGSSTFNGWTGCPDVQGNECTVIVNQARTVRATFALEWPLTVSRNGNGSGRVTGITGSGISCGTDCSESYDHNTPVVLTAVPATGSSLTRWTGCGQASGPRCTVFMTAPRNVTATFTLDRFTLTVAKNGSGTGTVTSNPAGISCGSDCSEDYDYGTSVALQALAGTGSSFGGWTNCPNASGATCTVPVTAAQTVTATFTLRSYVLTAAKNGNGSGAVTSSPAGISCGADCTQSYTYGTSVTLTAAASGGSSFGGWTNCPSASGNTCTVSVTAARTVTATFTLNSYVLTAAKSGAGSGTVTSKPGGISCGSDCTQSYNHGTSVTLTAAASNGSTFASWTNCPSASGNTCTVQMTAARTVTAVFRLNSYVLTVGKSGAGTGTVTSSPVGISCGSDCTQSYTYGTSVTLTAAPDPRMTFRGWSGCSSATNQCTVNVTAATTVTARFERNSAPNVTITSPADDSRFIYTDYDDALGMWYYVIDLKGSATDAEDGALTGQSLKWTTDRTDVQSPDLGTGESITVRIYSDDCFGVSHQIRLTATDKDGLSSSALITVSIYGLC